MLQLRAADFSLDPLLSRFVPSPVAAVLAPPLEALLSLRRAARTYAAIGPTATPVDFARRSLERLEARFEIAGATDAIPRTGPLVVIANHPCGGVEGLYLYALLASVRPDVRVLGTHLVARIAELRPVIIAVDVLRGRGAAPGNARALRSALRWVSRGGALVVFPAGEVASLDPARLIVTDPPWHAAIGRLIELAQATVVPVHVNAVNSRLFHAAGLVHPRLRTALLPRELFNKRAQSIGVRVGTPRAPDARGTGGGQLLRHLRVRTYALGVAPARGTGTALARRVADIAPAVAVERLRAEIDAQPSRRRIAVVGELEVWQLGAADAPWLMQELGRLREVTFRAVGEGTGRARDIDRYDWYYEQLLVWDRATAAVAGGYRLGAVDRIRARYGMRGLYSSTLFEFGRAALPRLRPALELGRSFVRPEYQKSYAPLLVLWKAIAAYLAARPQYRILFGPVSISNDYTRASQALLTGYLQSHHGDPALARALRARHPLPSDAATRALQREAAGLGSLEALEAVLRELEPDGKGVPVLLRQYLKLGARVAGFNVDPAFGNSIDVMVVAQLDHAAAAVLAKYMGREQAAAYLAAGAPDSGDGHRPRIGMQIGNKLRG